MVMLLLCDSIAKAYKDHNAYGKVPAMISSKPATGPTTTTVSDAYVTKYDTNYTRNIQMIYN